MLAQVALWLARLLVPLDYPIGVVEGQDPHPRRIGQRHPAHGDRDVGAVAAMRGDERLVVHLVYVVAG